MPLTKHSFAGRQKDDGVSGGPLRDEPTEKSLNRKPAVVAMGRIVSLTCRPFCIAARRADVRSLAIPVPAGTMNRTCKNRNCKSCKPWKSLLLARARLRMTAEKVYASLAGLRMNSQLTTTSARGVPRH
jgi:hypothetical protein